MTPVEKFLDTADWIEFAPQSWSPRSGDEKLAALVAYLTGDGSIAKKSQQYTKQNGETSAYKAKLQGAFYSNESGDLDSILNDCLSLGLLAGSHVTVKKNIESRVDGCQVQFSNLDANAFIESGCPWGKKTTVDFLVPEWVMEGSLGVKRAYLAALFGAEGSSPTKDVSSHSRLPRNPVLSMCKIEGLADGSAYFSQLREMLLDLGVVSTVTITKTTAFGKKYINYWLRVSGGGENYLAFFEKVGYVYCHKKTLEGWKWSKYLKAYLAESSRRRKTVVAMRGEGETFSSIARAIGLSEKGATTLYWNTVRGISKTTTAGHSFPHYKEWIETRWLKKQNLLRLEVVGRKFHEDRQVVWNLSVSSHDHSYLLASGANNFNSFESMSGRVYYPFDRKIHLKPLAFNPELPIWIGQDFNIDPMSSVVFQKQKNGELWAVDEICLVSSNTSELCDELERRYWRYLEQIVIYPDPAGAYRGHQRGESDLDIFRERGFRRQKYHKKHPPVADRVNSVNRMLQAANGSIRFFVDPKCKKLIEALEQTQYVPGSREVDKKAGVEHAADAAGYCIEFEFPVRRVEVLGISI